MCLHSSSSKVSLIWLSLELHCLWMGVCRMLKYTWGACSVQSGCVGDCSELWRKLWASGETVSSADICPRCSDTADAAPRSTCTGAVWVHVPAALPCVTVASFVWPYEPDFIAACCATCYCTAWQELPSTNSDSDTAVPG